MEDNKNAKETKKDSIMSAAVQILRDKIEAVDALAKAKGSHTQQEVRALLIEANKFIEDASKEYTMRKKRIGSIEKDYKNVVQELADKYKEDMTMYNVYLQKLEENLNKARVDLADAKERKSEIEDTPMYQSYTGVVSDYTKKIAYANKVGDLKKVKELTNELTAYQEDFEKSHTSQQLESQNKKIADLKKDIIELRDSINCVKEGEKEAKAQFAINKKKFVKEKNTNLTKVEKQSKLNALIGSIVAKFKGEKGFNKNILGQIKEKLELAKKALPRIKEDINDRQIKTIQTVTGVTPNENEIVKKFNDLKKMANKGITAITGITKAAKNKVVSDFEMKMREMEAKNRKQLLKAEFIQQAAENKKKQNDSRSEENSRC